MFDHNLSDGATRKAILHWHMLAFLAGSVNVGGFLACNRFVSHITGFATLFGMHAGEGRWDAAVGIASIPAFFLLGVMIAAYLVDLPFRAGRRPHYGLVMFLVAACLTAAALLGHFGFFGNFGTDARLKGDYFFLALLCAASGLQNAAITTSSGASVRTTHLTGLTTDLGIGLMRSFSSPRTDEGRKQRELEWSRARVRLGTWTSFALGGAVGAVVYMRFHFLGFLLPAALALYATAVAATSKASPGPRKDRGTQLLRPQA